VAAERHEQVDCACGELAGLGQKSAKGLLGEEFEPVRVREPPECIQGGLEAGVPRVADHADTPEPRAAAGHHAEPCTVTRSGSPTRSFTLAAIASGVSPTSSSCSSRVA